MVKMEKNYKFYDQICMTGLKWLIYNAKENEKKICFTNINSIDNEDKWLLSLAAAQNLMDGTKFYVHINFADYLALKYKYKFKFLKYCLRPNKYFIIDGYEFEKEIADSFEINRIVLSEIYNEYYRR